MFQGGRGAGMGSAGGMPHPQYLAFQLIQYTSIVFMNVVLLIKDKESPICQQTRLQRGLSVGKLGLCTPPTISFSFNSAWRHQIEKEP